MQTNVVGHEEYHGWCDDTRRSKPGTTDEWMFDSYIDAMSRE